jgi:hypothetical protein
MPLPRPLQKPAASLSLHRLRCRPSMMMHSGVFPERCDLVHLDVVSRQTHSRRLRQCSMWQEASVEVEKPVLPVREGYSVSRTQVRPDVMGHVLPPRVRLGSQLFPVCRRELASVLLDAVWPRDERGCWRMGNVPNQAPSLPAAEVKCPPRTQ